MAGFCTTYHQINDMNIKHLYSDYKEPIVRRKRMPNRIVAVREQDKLERQMKRFSLERRCNEFVPELNISLPRAPAFRGADKEQINEIVKRLYRPKTADPSSRRERMLSREKDESQRCKSAGAAPKRSSRPSSRSSQEVDLIVKRLYYSHTYTSRMRSCSTARG